MKCRDEFELIINSKDNIDGTSAYPNARFYFGSIYDNAPSLQRYADAPYCYIKMSYFSVKETAVAFQSGGIGSLVIRLQGALPNQMETITIAEGYNQNLTQGNIIGIMPTGASGFCYSTSTYNNEYVKCPNIFSGIRTISITNQDGGAYALDSTEHYFMILKVAFEMDGELNDNMNTISHKALNYDIQPKLFY